MGRIFIFVFAFFLVQSHNTFSQSITKIGYKEIGKASYYPDDRDGVITQGGYKFSKDSMYAAHKYFPFGSIIKVRNVNNGKIVNLKVIDRPYTSSRIIDMTYVAAQKIDIIGKNATSVEVTLIDTPQTLREKEKKRRELALKNNNKSASLPIDENLFKNVGTYNLIGKRQTCNGYGIQFATSNDFNFIINKGNFIKKNYLISPIFVQTGWSNGQKVYRLLIGNFENQEEGNSLIQLLKKGGYPDCFLKKHNNN